MSLSEPLTEKQNATLESSKRYFDEGFYDKVTPLLNSLLSQKINVPDIYHMLGTMYYEQGQFKASINSFKKALEIDPDFTDSSIGLSVVLNDLGKYEQASQVFKTAQNRLKNQTAQTSACNLIQTIASKHLELADLYSKNKNSQQAFENLIKYEDLMGETEDTVLKKSSILRSLDDFQFATQILRAWINKCANKENAAPNIQVYIDLVELYYLDRQPLSALSTCEEALKIAPENAELLNLYKNLKTTTFDLRQSEMTI